MRCARIINQRRFGTVPQSSHPKLYRRQLAELAPELYELLDPTWKVYLALPAEVFAGAAPPTQEALTATLAKYEAVSKNPEYSKITTRHEFQSTYALLKHY